MPLAFPLTKSLDEFSMSPFAAFIAFLLLCFFVGVANGVFWLCWVCFGVAIFAVPLWLINVGDDDDNLQDLDAPTDQP